MGATLAALVKVRSQQVEDVLSYLRALETNLAKNPLLDRFGRRLDDLRVPLRVVPYQPVQDIEEVRLREHFRQSSVSRDDDDPDKAARRVYASRGSRFEEDKPDSVQPERLADFESTLDMAVLLGDPGSGKTEWLKHRARSAAKMACEQLEAFAVHFDALCLPVYVRLREVAAALAKDAELRDLLLETSCLSVRRATLSDAERMAAAILSSLIAHHHLPRQLAPWVWRKLTTPRQPDAPFAKGDHAQHGEGAASLLLCLDAWDEVRSGQDGLANCLKAFAGQVQATIFLTSRVIGYSHRLVPVENTPQGPRRELQICPFEWNETETFVTAFFHRDPDPERGRKMLTELRSKMAVTGMAQNPLLATLLCLAFAPSPDAIPLALPARRVEIYERVLKGLLGEWSTLRTGKSPNKGLVTQKILLLEELALHFFPGEAMTEGQLETFLWGGPDGYLVKLKDAHPLIQLLRRNPDATLLDELCNDGVLVPCGGAPAEEYLFIHLTFQEYLTASALARRGWEAITAQIDKKAWSPTWREVIVLLAGQLTDPKPLLTMLHNEEPTETNPYGDDAFYHRLALAALCLPEISSVLRTQHSELFNLIAAQIWKRWWKDKQQHIDAAVGHLGHTLPALTQVNAKVDKTSLIDHLVSLLRAPGRDVRWAAAQAVGELGRTAATPIFLEQLAGLLRVPERDVRWAAAQAVGELGSAAATPIIVEHLTRLLRDPERDVRAAAAAAVGQLGSDAATPEMLTYLTDWLQDSHEWMREEAARVVGRLMAQGVRIFRRRFDKCEVSNVDKLSGEE